MQNILLLYPPCAKICEPPAGIAYLAGALRQPKISYTKLDLNIECSLAIMGKKIDRQDTWSKRASKNYENHLQALKKTGTYQNISKYKRAVNDLNHLMQINTPETTELSLSNYEEQALSPVDSKDLLHAYEHPEENIFSPFFSKRLDQLFLENGYSHLGLSICYLSQALPAFAIAGYVKEHWPETKIIMGGGLITSWCRSSQWQDQFSHCYDMLISGPGECELVEKLGKQSGKPPFLPDYSGLADNSYLAPGFILPFTTSTGCPWNRCAFCPERAEKSQYSQLGQQDIRSHLTRLVQQYHPSLIHFLDNSLSTATMKGLIDQPPKADWYGFTRVSKHLAEPSFCQQLKQSGCTMLKLGIESGSQQVLDQMEKGTELATISKALRAISGAGIATYVYLLFGTPGEDYDQARKTLEFVVEHADCISFLNLAIFNMPVDSEESRLYPSTYFSGGDLSLYRNFSHPKGWDRQSIRKFLSKEFKSHPAIKPILANDPPFFTSNHAPFMGL